MDKVFSERIKQLRQKNDWSVRRLAEKVGVSLMTVYRWESGKVVPKSEVVKRKIHQLEVS
jgi:transcriptional regulator with XRE-family HTH domain